MALTVTEQSGPRAPRSVASRGVIAVLVAFAGLSLGSTMAKSVGSPGAVVAFWRFLVGALLWHGVVAARGVRLGQRRTVEPRAWRLAALSGVAFGVNLSCFFTGVTRTPIAHAEFISAMTPLVVVPLAAVMLKERVPRFVLGFGVVALAGIVMILSRAPSSGRSYTGDLLIVAAVAAWVVYLLTAKSARAQLDTVSFMAVMSTAAALTTLPIALLEADGPSGLVDLSARGWALVFALAVVSGMVSHGLIAWAQPHVAVGTISVLQFAQPTLGVLWAAIFLDETVAPVQVLGMAVVVVAVGAIVRRTANPRAGAR
jgi:drug/metabolite transporter (DMT)-like permease